MEWIDEETGIRTTKEIVAANEILTSLDEYGKDTSIYALHLLDAVDQEELYLLTSKGKLYNGGVMCKYTKTKDRINSKDIVVNLITNNTGLGLGFQFLLTFKDGTSIDARGLYARTALKVLRSKGK